jgi:hypothetical protein
VPHRAARIGVRWTGVPINAPIFLPPVRPNLDMVLGFHSCVRWAKPLAAMYAAVRVRIRWRRSFSAFIPVSAHPARRTIARPRAQCGAGSLRLRHLSPVAERH